MTVYLLHFDRPFRHARHYLGSAADLVQRLHDHQFGGGANIVRRAAEDGVRWQLVRTWTCRTTKEARKLEADFKRAQHNTRLCPICNRDGACRRGAQRNVRQRAVSSF